MAAIKESRAIALAPLTKRGLDTLKGIARGGTRAQDAVARLLRDVIVLPDVPLEKTTVPHGAEGSQMTNEERRMIRLIPEAVRELNDAIRRAGRAAKTRAQTASSYRRMTKTMETAIRRSRKVLGQSTR